VREAAIRFIGKPPPLVPLWAVWSQGTSVPGVTLLRGGGRAAQPAGPGAVLLEACWVAGGLMELCA